MSEKIWLEGKDPVSMLQSLEAVIYRKRRMTAAALLRRCARVVSPSALAIVELLESDEQLSQMVDGLLQRELDAFDSRQERTLRSVATQPGWAAQSEGQDVTYPAEVANAAAALLEEEAARNLISAESIALEALRVELNGHPIVEIVGHVRSALLSEGRAVVQSAVAASWRQYADQIAEQTANQPRKRKILISNAVEYIQRGRDALENKEGRKVREVELAESAAASILHDIFGNPFRPVTLDPRWRTSSVIDLAGAIYEERAYERMPILADALMDAGCDSEDMIAHCRGNEAHVRGCWVLDLLLDRR